MDIKNNLYTVILGYKNSTYIYQLFAKQEIEAQFLWISKLDLNKLGLFNANSIKDELMEDANNEVFYPGLLNGLQSVWCSCVSSLGKDLAIANIVNTLIIKKNSSEKNDNTLLQFSKEKKLYTVQLNYKGGTYVSQVFAFNQIEAQIEWIKQLNFNVIAGVPKNIEEIRNNLLLQQNEPIFSPQELKGFDSTWGTNFQLGEDIGRVTIVATQTNVYNFPQAHPEY